MNADRVAGEIRDRVKMSDVIRNAGLEINRAGFVTCPFHAGDHSASLKVYPNSFNCFGCGKGGDAVKFVQLFYNVSFSDAVRKINDDFHLCLPLDRKMSLAERRNYDALYRQRQRQIQAERAEEARKNAEYGELMDLYCRYDNAIRNAPIDSEEYAEAIKNISIVEYRLDCLKEG